MKSVSIAVYGVNSAGQSEYKSFDHYCPLLPGQISKPNYWKSLCEHRQKQPCNASTCYPSCHAKSEAKKYGGRNNAQFAVSVGKEWRKLKEEGMSFIEIAKKANCSPTTVRRYVKLAGGTIPKKHKVTYARFGREFFNLLQVGATIAEIAEDYKISPSTVQRHAKDYSLGIAA